jgi:hypothetical protein
MTNFNKEISFALFAIPFFTSGNRQITAQNSGTQVPDLIEGIPADFNIK